MHTHTYVHNVHIHVLVDRQVYVIHVIVDRQMCVYAYIHVSFMLARIYVLSYYVHDYMFIALDFSNMEIARKLRLI